jgi:hypothetical protein
MKISYAITIKDELIELERLLNTLGEYKRAEDEIVIVYDSKNGSKSVDEFLRSKTVSATPFQWHSFEFEGHFADLKNYLTKQCIGDYIVQIDADEYPNQQLIKNLPILLEANNQVDVFLVPRVNTVEGITDQHIMKWGWNLNDEGWINFPDFQWRIYRNTPDIYWINKVHERLNGFKSYATLPSEEEWSLYHPKDIKRQEKQNSYYDTL